MADALARADRDGALHHEHDPARIGGQLVDDRPDRREVCVAGVRRRRPDGDVDELGPVDRLANVEREEQPLAVLFEQLVQARLVDRDSAVAQRVDLRLVDVADRHVVSELREARARDQADVTSAEDCDLAQSARSST